MFFRAYKKIFSRPHVLADDRWMVITSTRYKLSTSIFHLFLTFFILTFFWSCFHLMYRISTGNQSLDELNVKEAAGLLVQYPDTNGEVKDLTALTALCKENGSILVSATDLLACTIIKPPGEYGPGIITVVYAN